MVLTIYEGFDNSYIMVGGRSKEFMDRYGSTYRVSKDNFYKALAEISEWANNELGEECLFEID